MIILFNPLPPFFRYTLSHVQKMDGSHTTMTIIYHIKKYKMQEPFFYVKHQSEEIPMKSYLKAGI